MNWINRTSERVPNETQSTSFGFILKLAAGFACCLSLLMSWCFWSSLGHGHLTIFLLAAAGLLFDVTKILSVPMTLCFWKQEDTVLPVKAHSKKMGAVQSRVANKYY